MEAKTTPRCYTLVMGCCATGTCNLKEGSCGCENGKCGCPADCNCKKDDVRVKPDLGGSNGLLWVGAALVIAVAGGAAFFIKQNK